jgi:hypothetical protein
LERKAKEALLTPEQKERAALEKERDDAKASAKKLADEAKKREEAEADAKTERELEESLIAAADHFKLEGTPETLEGMCDAALYLMDMGISKPSTEQIVAEFLRQDEEAVTKKIPKVVGRLKGDALKQYLKANLGPLSKMPAAELLEVLGPDLVRQVQDATLTKVPTPNFAPVKTPAAIPPRNGSGRFMSEAQFDAKAKRR